MPPPAPAVFPSSSPGPASRTARDDEADLLAALLTGAPAISIDRDAAMSLIEGFGGLAGLSSADDAALRRHGLRDPQIAMLGRARALALAMARAEACRRPVLSSWTALTAYLRAGLAHLPREEFRVLYLDKRNILMCEEHRAVGTVDHAPVYVREVVRRALEVSASAMILVHNHPSGDPTPSRPDVDMTRKIIEAARVFDIQVHDHVVVGREGTKSFRSLGLI